MSTAFASLISELWKGTNQIVYPKKFRAVLSDLARDNDLVSN